MSAMRLTCADTEARLVDVTDGRLDPSVEVRVHAHLESCATCRAKAELWWALVPRMRALSPPPPAELGARRIEVAVLRSLQSEGAIEAKPGHRWRSVTAAAVVVTAAAALLVWLRVGKPSPRLADGGAAARVSRIAGAVTSDGRALGADGALPFGGRLEVAAAGEAELRMDRGSVLRLRGPARLALQGTARQVLVRLEEGALEAEVAHRLPDETFAVWVREFVVRVRGTRFVVDSNAAGAAVRVQDGLVAVELADGSTRLVGAGQEQVVPAIAIGEAAPAAPLDPPAARAPLEAPPVGSAVAVQALSCPAAVRRCEGTARGVRSHMREGDDDEALRLLGGATRLAREVAPGCARELAPCTDELGYLRAEALRASGRIDEAVGAYVALNRPTAPAAMRQNALYAAAEMERRRGRPRVARRYYEGALGAAPRGALREEALIGSMECAAAAGDTAQAAMLARRYLAAFPAGRASGAADRLLGKGTGATATSPDGP